MGTFGVPLSQEIFNFSCDLQAFALAILFKDSILVTYPALSEPQGDAFKAVVVVDWGFTHRFNGEFETLAWVRRTPEITIGFRSKDRVT